MNSRTAKLATDDKDMVSVRNDILAAMQKSNDLKIICETLNVSKRLFCLLCVDSQFFFEIRKKCANSVISCLSDYDFEPSDIPKTKELIIELAAMGIPHKLVLKVLNISNFKFIDFLMEDEFFATNLINAISISTKFEPSDKLENVLESLKNGLTLEKIFDENIIRKEVFGVLIFRDTNFRKKVENIIGKKLLRDSDEDEPKSKRVPKISKKLKPVPKLDRQLSNGSGIVLKGKALQKQENQDLLISKLEQGRSLEDTLKLVGIKISTLKNWMKEFDFQQKIEKYKEKIEKFLSGTKGLTGCEIQREKKQGLLLAELKGGKSLIDVLGPLGITDSMLKVWMENATFVESLGEHKEKVIAFLAKEQVSKQPKIKEPVKAKDTIEPKLNIVKPDETWKEFIPLVEKIIEFLKNGMSFEQACQKVAIVPKFILKHPELKAMIDPYIVEKGNPIEVVKSEQEVIQSIQIQEKNPELDLDEPVVGNESLVQDGNLQEGETPEVTTVPGIDAIESIAKKEKIQSLEDKILDYMMQNDDIGGIKAAFGFGLRKIHSLLENNIEFRKKYEEFIVQMHKDKIVKINELASQGMNISDVMEKVKISELLSQEYNRIQKSLDCEKELEKKPDLPKPNPIVKPEIVSVIEDNPKENLQLSGNQKIFVSHLKSGKSIKDILKIIGKNPSILIKWLEGTNFAKAVEPYMDKINEYLSIKRQDFVGPQIPEGYIFPEVVDIVKHVEVIQENTIVPEVIPENPVIIEETSESSEIPEIVDNVQVVDTDETLIITFKEQIKNDIIKNILNGGFLLKSFTNAGVESKKVGNFLNSDLLFAKTIYEIFFERGYDNIDSIYHLDFVFKAAYKYYQNNGQIMPMHFLNLKEDKDYLLKNIILWKIKNGSILFQIINELHIRKNIFIQMIEKDKIFFDYINDFIIKGKLDTNDENYYYKTMLLIWISIGEPLSGLIKKPEYKKVYNRIKEDQSLRDLVDEIRGFKF